MSTWTCSPKNRAAALIGAALTCAAADPAAALPRPDLEPAGRDTALAVLDDRVVIAAPSGYCIDPLGSVATDSHAFVLMASCGALAGRVARADAAAPGLLTASVDGAASGQGMPSRDELDAYFRSAAGNAAVAGTDAARPVAFGESYAHDGIYFARFQDAAGATDTGGQSWRAVFEVNGHMVMATLREFAGQPIAVDAGFRTVEQFVARIVSASLPLR